MCGGLKKRYILTALVCFGAVMSGGGFAQAESTTAESRSETRTTVDRNGTIAERVRRTESRTTVSSDWKTGSTGFPSTGNATGGTSPPATCTCWTPVGMTPAAGAGRVGHRAAPHDETASAFARVPAAR